MKRFLLPVFIVVFFLFCKSVNAAGSSISLYPAHQDVTISSPVLVDVILDTEDLNISGFDIVLDIDDRYFSTKVIPGKILALSNYSLSAERQATFNSQARYKGRVVIGSVHLTPIKNGQTKVAVNFSKSKIFGPDGITNILDSTTDASFLIKGEVLAAATVDDQATVPQTGVVENVLVIFISALVLVYVGKKLWIT